MVSGKTRSQEGEEEKGRERAGMAERKEEMITEAERNSGEAEKRNAPKELEAVFIDRDGTMCESADIEFPWQFSPLPGLSEMLEEIRSTGAKLFVFSNQSCIARGKDGGYDFEGEFQNLGFDDWFICPHDKEDACSCRKPASGLLQEAKEKYGLHMENCYVIGDRWSDMLPGGKMGCRLLLVLTGRGREALGEDREKWSRYTPDFVAPTLREAASWLKEQYGKDSGKKAQEKEPSALPECLPKDPFILLSYVNTKLRDEGWNLESFCRETGASAEILCKILGDIDYEYDGETRRFV